MSVTVGRAKVVDFTEPYYYDGGAVAVPTDSTHHSPSTELDGGKTFCVGTATTYEQWLNRHPRDRRPEHRSTPPTDPQITALPTDNECIQAVAGRPHVRRDRRQQQRPRGRGREGRPIQMLLDDPPIFTVSVAFALDKSGPGTAAMLAVLNEIVADMHADGTLSGFSRSGSSEDVTDRTLS